MRIEGGTEGIVATSDDGRVEMGPALPAVQCTVDGRAVDTAASSLDATEGRWVASLAGTPLRAEIELGDDRVRARLVHDGASTSAVAVERFALLRTDELRVGDDPRRWRAYRNGYQSWAGTWTIGMDESDVEVPTRAGRMGVTDAKHAAPSDAGHVRSDSVGAVADPASGTTLALGFTTLADAFGFVELVAPHGEVESFDIWVDLDSTRLAPGASTPWFEIAIADGPDALATVVDAAGIAMGALGRDEHHPGGWCSWYFYFTKVTEADVMTNLDVLAADGRDGERFGCEYVMVDDGHQTAIGDWRSTNDKFPSGMAAVAGRIRDAGFDAGIWWAPFIAGSDSQLVAEHPDWLVRNERGAPIVGLLNPGWGVRNPMRVLDTTNPEVLDHLRGVAADIAAWGYRIQKIDFLFAASMPGVRHDPDATRAHALRRGLQAVRDGAGDDSFVLGCGCPLGPAVGLVDAMRIGADVTPSWTTLIARTAGRGRHALATKNALLNTLTRSVFDRRWFLNDPDCLMVRDRDTKLTLEEVRLMCTVFGMTDGMIVLSDRMDQLAPERVELVARTRDLAGGRCEVVDLFERAEPELIVSRHGDGRVDVGLLNLGDRPRRGLVDLDRLGVGDRATGVREFWTGQTVAVTGPIADVGTIPAHGARVLRFS